MKELRDLKDFDRSGGLRLRGIHHTNKGRECARCKFGTHKTVEARFRPSLGPTGVPGSWETARGGGGTRQRGFVGPRPEDQHVRAPFLRESVTAGYEPFTLHAPIQATCPNSRRKGGGLLREQASSTRNPRPLTLNPQPSTLHPTQLPASRSKGS